MRQYHGMPYGPVEIHRDDDGVWARAATGRTALVRMPYQTPLPHGDETLRAGVDIEIDGEVVARAHQRERGQVRSKRVVHVTPVRPGFVPDGTVLRYRGWIPQKWLVAGDRVLVRPAATSIGPWLRTLHVADGVSDDVSIAYAAMIGAFHFALT